MAEILKENSSFLKAVDALDKQVTTTMSSKLTPVTNSNEKKEENVLNSSKRTSSNSSLCPRPKRFKSLHVSSDSDSLNSMEELFFNYVYNTPKDTVNLNAKTHLTDKISKLHLSKELNTSGHSIANESIQDVSHNLHPNFEQMSIDLDDSRKTELVKKHANEVEMVELPTSNNGKARKGRATNKTKSTQNKKTKSKKEKSRKDIEREINKLLNSSNDLRRSERLRAKKLKSLELEREKIVEIRVANKYRSKRVENSKKQSPRAVKKKMKMKISNKLFKTHSKLI